MVSIILPVYNRQAYVEECIQSVQAQSYQNLEIIIVDDGSTDDSYMLCKKLAAEDSRIKLHQANHSGVSAARNLALDMACGDYIFFLDSDDVIHPNLLETLVSHMKETGALMGGTDVARVTEKYWHKVREKLDETSAVGEIRLLTHEETLEEVFTRSCPFSCIGGVIIRRDLIVDTKFRTDLYIGEDFFFIYENLTKGCSCVFLKQKWYYVRNHAHNTSWDWSYSGFRTRFDRRILVARSEETLGRKKYADIQKREAFACYVLCSRKNKPYSKDNKQMRYVLHQYRKDLLPALSLKGKLSFFLHLHFPALMLAFFCFHVRIKKQ